MAHRGPDGAEIWQSRGIALAHRRLAIIDLDGGRQPLGNEDGSIQVVFNGEIYNHVALRTDLKNHGHRFRTESDTEVLVHLYEDLGDRLIERLRGMFAFAIWDSRHRRLLLARDRVGIKPLYYFAGPDRFVFASELKALLCDPDVPRDVDPGAIDEYLTYGFIGGDRTIFRGIRKLPPAHTLVVADEARIGEPRRYWRWTPAVNSRLTENEWLEAVDAKLRETINAHVISDVPVGAFLSGGIDSSAIVSEWSRMGGKVRAFSIGFADERHNELPYAADVAARFGVEHVFEIVTPQAAESLAELVTYFDEPFADTSAVPMLAVAKLAARHVKVVLSGDGGDEAFAGYTRYSQDLREDRVRGSLPGFIRNPVLRRLAEMWPHLEWLPRPLRWKNTLANLSLNRSAAYANTLSLWRGKERRSLLHPDLRRSVNGHRSETFVETAFTGHDGHALDGMLAADIGYLLPDDFLTKVDRAGMAFGLEIRPPFLDHELLELTAQIPAHWKIRHGQTKWLLRKLMQKKLPTSVLKRRKQGFDLPIDDWLKKTLRPLGESVFGNRNSRLAAVIDIDVARRHYDDHLEGRVRRGRQLWSLLVLSEWLDRYTSAADPFVAPTSGNIPSVRLPSPVLETE